MVLLITDPFVCHILEMELRICLISPAKVDLLTALIPLTLLDNTFVRLNPLLDLTVNNIQ